MVAFFLCQEKLPDAMHILESVSIFDLKQLLLLCPMLLGAKPWETSLQNMEGFVTDLESPDRITHSNAASIVWVALLQVPCCRNTALRGALRCAFFLATCLQRMSWSHVSVYKLTLQMI